jgi:uroporphyrinogen decarboxylase
MTGRERIHAALTFIEPDRIPRDLWALPYVSLFHPNDLKDFIQRFPMDIGRAELASGADEQRLKRLAKPGTYTDEWSSVWQVGEPGIIGEVKKPVLADWHALRHFQPPWQEIRGRDFRHVNRQCETSDQYMISAVTARPFERVQFLRGSENTFMDLAYQTKEIRSLIELLHDYYLQDVES